MKRTVSLLLCAALLMSLCACRAQETIALTEFLARWNRVSDQPLRLEDFFLEDDVQQTRRFALLDGGLLLRLIADGDENLTEARLILPKAAPDGTPLLPTEDQITLFCDAAQAMLCAFCDLSPERANATAAAFGLDQTALVFRQGEQTAQIHLFYLTWLSNALECVFVIDNTRLVEIETTRKPERRQPFDATTATRTDTVPHK
ncbi:MAG: hypothetical protein IJL52_07030 [Clostridia bacterium]|nr:hypothetical protein [Clostridia bacterium]